MTICVFDLSFIFINILSIVPSYWLSRPCIPITHIRNDPVSIRFFHLYITTVKKYVPPLVRVRRYCIVHCCRVCIVKRGATPKNIVFQSMSSPPSFRHFVTLLLLGFVPQPNLPGYLACCTHVIGINPPFIRRLHEECLEQYFHGYGFLLPEFCQSRVVFRI